MLLDLGSRRSSVAMEQRSGKPYVSLKDMISALRLEGWESKDRFNSVRSRAESSCFWMDGRWFGRGVDYLLMSSPRHGEKGPSDWYIPEAISWFGRWRPSFRGASPRPALPGIGSSPGT